MVWAGSQSFSTKAKSHDGFLCTRRARDVRPHSFVFLSQVAVFLRQKWPIRQGADADSIVTGRVCGAVNRASVWYPKKALCPAFSRLLRSHGIPARMTLGVRPMLFMAHAWVEVEGSVVNDLPGVKTFYPSLVSY
jgi:hypothetical protein